MIWIRADGNHEIGIGHIMRCISIAEEMQRMGQAVCFVVADECASELLQRKKQQYIVLHTEYDRMESEVEILKQLIYVHKPDLLLVDSYSVTKQYFEQIKTVVKTAYMDDLGDNVYPVNLLINYNVYATAEMYNRGKDSVERFLIGTQYVPLRNEFRTRGKEVAQEVKDIFISTGGSDKYNLTVMMLDCLMRDEELKKLNYHIICGNFNAHVKELEQRAKEYDNISVYINVTNIAEIMKKCDLAVSAAGSTLYELAALGIPSIVFSFADNQKKAADAFELYGASISVGHYDVDNKDEFMSSIVKEMKVLCTDYNKRLKMAQDANGLVDGQGAIRLARAIAEYK